MVQILNWEALSKFITLFLHCNKTLPRIPPPWPDGAGPNGQGGEYFVPRPCWYFIFLHEGRPFLNSLEINSVYKRKSVGREGSNSRPWEYSCCPINLDHGYLAWEHKYKPSSDISGMEKCKMPAWTRDNMFWYPIEGFFIPRTAIFQRRASFWIAFVTVYYTMYV